MSLFVPHPYGHSLLQNCMIQPIQTAFAKRKKHKPPPPVPFYVQYSDGYALPFAYACSLGYTPTPKPFVSIQFTGSLEDSEHRRQTYDVESNIQWLLQYRSVLIELPCSSGKTVIAACIAARSGKFVIVLVNRKPLVKQWAGTFSKVTDALVWCVHDRPPPSYNVIISTPRKLLKLSPDIRAACGILLVDEADRLCTKGALPALLAVQPEYVVSMTATPWRDDGMDKALWLLNSGSNARESRRPFTVYTLRTRIRPDYQKGDWHGLLNAIFGDPARNDMLVRLVENSPEKKFMILTRRQEHCEKLLELMYDAGIQASTFYGDQVMYSEARCLIGTSDKIGIGFDEASFCADYSGIPADVIVFPATVLSKSLYYQMVGRGFRSKNPTIIQFLDDDPTAAKHWKEEVKVINMLGGTIVDGVLGPG